MIFLTQGRFNNLFNYLLDLISLLLPGFEPYDPNLPLWLNVFQRVIIIYILVTGVLLSYRGLFLFIGFIFRSKKYSSQPQNNNYAVILAARNEEKVIGNLIESLQRQTYDNSKITIFVMAHNCTDDTAKIARNLGTIVYEHTDLTKRRKGYALEVIFNKIEEDYKIQSFDGYFFFDSDNIVANNFIEKMHDAFVANKKGGGVRGYRNVKNFDQSIITSMYGIASYNNHLNFQRPRSFFKGGSCFISGTGFVVESEVFKDGWKWFTLSEDNELSCDVIMQNKKITFCEEAEFFDENPTKFRQMITQRRRWSRGGFTVFIKKTGQVMKSFLKKPTLAKYDLIVSLIPFGLITFILSSTFSVAILFFDQYASLGDRLIRGLLVFLLPFFTGWLSSFMSGVLVMIREHRHFKYKWYKILWFLLWWPFFGAISNYIFISALIWKVEWKTIHRVNSSTIEDIEEIFQLPSTSKE